MPIYEYKCQDCSHVEEHLMKLSDPPPRHCVKCHGSNLEKLMSQTSFALKGSGWYVTDYKPKAGGSAEPGGAGAPAASGASEALPASSAGDAAPAAGAAAAATPSSGSTGTPAAPAAKPKVTSSAE